MSILSKLTHIHIGSGPKPVQAPPPGTLSPEAQQAFDSMNGTINRGHSLNTGAMAAVPIAIGGSAALGLGGFGSGGAAAGEVGAMGAKVPIGAAAGGADAAGSVVDIPAAGELAGGAETGAGWFDKAKQFASGAGDWLGKANDATGGGSGLDKVLLAASIADAAASKKRQMDLQNKGLDYATDAYSAKQPLRQRGLELMQDEQAPDLSSIFVNPKNPYNKTVPVPQVGTRVPIGGPVMPKGGTY